MLQVDAASELLFLQAASTAQAEQLNCMRIFNVDSNEVQHRNFNFQLQLQLLALARSVLAAVCTIAAHALSTLQMSS
jgi:hypothetical protein